MNGAITFYPDATHEILAAMSGTSGLLHLEDSAYAPTLLVSAGDQQYLRDLAALATDLADRMDAAQTGPTS